MTTPTTDVASTDRDRRIAALRRPAPRLSQVAGLLVVAAFVVLGIVSINELGITVDGLTRGFDALPQFLDRTTPLLWPGYTRTGDEVTFTEPDQVPRFFGLIGITLGIVIAGTTVGAVLSVPVAYLAARNTSPHPTVLAVARAIGVVARAVPDVALAAVLVLIMQLGALPGIVAIGLHSVGMLSKMFAEAIEQIDEGPRLAIRSAGGSRQQEFWSGIFPQVLPAWVAVALHRADINLRSSVLLGLVGVSGLGYELTKFLDAHSYRRALPIAITIVLLCVLFEIVSSTIRSRLLGVQPSGPGLGNRIVRAAARRSRLVRSAITKPAITKPAITKPGVAVDRSIAIEAALRRPWTGERFATTLSIWIAVAVVVAAFWISDVKWGDLIAVWGNFDRLDGKLWPISFGARTWPEVLHAVFVTVEVAFAATLLSSILVAIVGTLAARNVARNPVLRNTFRGVLLFIRGIPELILIIVLVIVTGLGPVAGVLGLGFAGVGLMGKLVADSLEEVPGGPERAILASGGNRLQVFFASTVPYSVPSFVSHMLYVFEQNVRAAVLLGWVGGGGIGAFLFEALAIYHYNYAIAFLLVIIPLTAAIEGAAILLRRALR